MRATISFEVDVDRVQETMGAVVREELQPLHQAMDLLEVSKPHDLRRGISEALEILGAVTNQLEQYRDMLASFEKARFETVLPQDASIPLAVDAAPAEPDPQSVGEMVRSMREVQRAMRSMGDFDTFIQRIQNQDDGEQEDTENDEKSPKG